MSVTFEPISVNARVLVTGAAGFVGAHFCQAMLDRGPRVVAIVHGERGAKLAGAETRDVDLRDRDAVRDIVQQVDPTHVVHLAGRKLSTSLADTWPSFEANLLTTVNLAEAVIDTGGCQRFVYMGSAEEYGRAAVPFDSKARETPLTSYGLSKLAATQMLQALAVTHALPVAILRATVVYGPGQPARMLVPALVRALVDGTRFPMTMGDQTRDLVYVDDVVDGIMRALVTPGTHHGALHLSGGEPVAIREVALLTARLVGGGAESLLGFGDVRPRHGEAMAYWADNATTAAVLGWTPQVTLEEGLRRTIAHYRAAPAGV